MPPTPVLLRDRTSLRLAALAKDTGPCRGHCVLGRSRIVEGATNRSPFVMLRSHVVKRATKHLSAGAIGLPLVVALSSAAPPAAQGACPAPDEVRAQIADAGLERAARTARFSTPPPRKLYDKAAGQVGELVIDRDGQKGFGVVLVELPVEVLWRAINDEDAHDTPGYLPLSRSEIAGGTPRGTARRVFQAGEKMGLGRWWLTETTMSGALYEASGARLWETAWEADTEALQQKRAPVDDPPDLSPIEWTRGAWLLVPLGDGCTLLEHFTWSEPGGFVGLVQGMVLGRALRESVEGMVRLAAERYRTPPAGPPFVRPDGTPLSLPADAP
jgi:hypothetical protein